MSVQMVGWDDFCLGEMFLLDFFGELDALPEAGFQARTYGYCDEINVVEVRHPRFGCRAFCADKFFEKFRQIFLMLALCQVWHYSAPGAVSFDLGGGKEFYDFDPPAGGGRP